MNLVTLYANDDDRALHIDPHDLHPNSRLRGVILHDERTSLRVNIGRDALRSIAASQRHNRVICVGEAHEDEVLSELKRDCVDVGPAFEVPAPIDRLCRHIVAVFSAWPRLARGFRSLLKGRAPEWNASPTHCLLRLACKPRTASCLRDRPLLDLAMHCVLAWRVGSLEDAIERIPLSRIDDELSRLSEPGPFWHVAYDDDPMHQTDAKAFVRVISNRADDGSCPWCASFADGIRRMHRDTVDPTRLFVLVKDRPTVALRFLSHLLELEGWTTLSVGLSNPTESVPLVFPTAWAGCSSNRDGVFMMLERALGKTSL